MQNLGMKFIGHGDWVHLLYYSGDLSHLLE